MIRPPIATTMSESRIATITVAKSSSFVSVNSLSLMLNSYLFINDW